MGIASRSTAALVGAVLAAACSEPGAESSDGDAEAGTGSAGSCVSPDDEGNLRILAAEPNNYAFSSSLTLDTVKVAANSPLDFDWSSLSHDFVGQSLDPLRDIDMVVLVLWALPKAELEQKLNDDALASSDLEAVVQVYTENSISSANLLDFTSFGSFLEADILLSYMDPSVYDPSGYSYSVLVATGTTPGEGTRMLVTFELDDAESNTLVEVRDDSADLTYSVDLDALAPVQVPTGEASLVVDWGSLATNAMGREFVATQITEVIVAHYALDVPELEEQFLSLETIADDLWRGDVPAGTELDTSTLLNEAGQPFAGLDDSGTWVVALMCGGCANPAPWYLSVLEGCAE
jgi:hypothetical protein